jgi:hypothetical protein
MRGLPRRRRGDVVLAKQAGGIVGPQVDPVFGARIGPQPLEPHAAIGTVITEMLAA